MALFEPNRQTIVSADASAYGLGAVLCQKQPDGSLRPNAYVSRAMTECEQNPNRKRCTSTDLGL